MSKRDHQHEAINVRLWPITVAAHGRAALFIAGATAIVLLVLAYRLAVG